MRLSLCHKLSSCLTCFLSVTVVEVIETDIKGDVVRMYESETIELKEIYTPDLKKEVVAFANTNGGTIYIGFSSMAR